jgi:Uma2 family endonuclease
MTEHALVEAPSAPVKLRAEDFFLLGESGALSAYKKTELIDGVIIALSPAHSLHGRVQRALFLALHEGCEQIGGMESAFEISVVLGPHNVVQPDVMVVTSLPEGGPLAASMVKLAVAVSDTTLAEDLAKTSRYAAGGIPECWVADANARVIHRMWSPGPDGYAERDETRLLGRTESVTIPGLAAEIDQN